MNDRVKIALVLLVITVLTIAVVLCVVWGENFRHELKMRCLPGELVEFNRSKNVAFCENELSGRWTIPIVEEGEQR